MSIDAPKSARTITFPRLLVLCSITLCAPFGDTFLDIGMKRLPAIELSHPSSLISAVLTPWVAGGIALLLVWFGSQISALSWADLSYLLPVTSFGNVIVALLAWRWRHEQISSLRWIGILLITAGVGFVARGPSYTPPPQPVLEPSKESAQ